MLRKFSSLALAITLAVSGGAATALAKTTAAEKEQARASHSRTAESGCREW
jgi:hypothetical protein